LKLAWLLGLINHFDSTRHLALVGRLVALLAIKVSYHVPNRLQLAGTRNRLTAPYVFKLSDPFSTDFEGKTKHAIGVVHPRHTSKAAYEVATFGGEDPESR
jgi:hypothetical protein